MKFRMRQDYPTSLEHLWAAFGDADYPEQKYRALGSSAVQILRFTATAKLIEVELERKARVVVAKLPAWARPFADGEQRMRHHSKWWRVSPTQVNAELDIVPVGLPVRAHATGSAVELTATQTRLTLSIEVKCWLPGIGATVARLFAEQMKEALRADHAFTLRYLERAEERLSKPGAAQPPRAADSPSARG
jgi:hypothetical protein